jgi:hypothetical protein
MFYKVIDNELIARRGVSTPEITLIESGRQISTYPVEGWIWATYENEARSYFGLPLIDITQEK